MLHTMGDHIIDHDFVLLSDHHHGLYTGLQVQSDPVPTTLLPDILQATDLSDGPPSPIGATRLTTRKPLHAALPRGRCHARPVRPEQHGDAPAPHVRELHRVRLRRQELARVSPAQARTSFSGVRGERRVTSGVRFARMVVHSSPPSQGQYCHLDAPHYILSGCLHTKYNV